MSQENVEKLRAAWDAWNRGEFDMSMLDPNVVFEGPCFPTTRPTEATRAC